MAKNTMRNIWSDKQKENERLAKKLERKKTGDAPVKKTEDAKTEDAKG